VTFTAIFIMIFLIAFALIGGLVMFLSRTIEHGEARFDANGKMMTDDEPKHSEPARPARRIEQSDTAGDNA
jgi:hypothetical protein